MFGPRVSRALLPFTLALGLVAGPAPAIGLALHELVPTEVPDWADSVADPGEVEDPSLELGEFFDAGFATPDAVKTFVERELGVPFEVGAAPTLVVVRNAGSGYRPSPSEAAYDDLFLVVSGSQVHQYAHGNAEGTEHRTYVRKYGYDQHVDPDIGEAMTPALAPGRYRFKVGKHRNQYKALRVTSMDWARDPLPSQRRNGRRGAHIVGAVNVHKGGSTWNWSVGCLTVHYASYQDFIDRFSWAEWGHMYVVGDWDGAPPEGHQLLPARDGKRVARFRALHTR